MVTDQFPFPSALQWKGVADLIARGLRSLPPSAVVAMAVAAVAAAVIEVARIATRGRFPLTSVSVGLGVVLAFLLLNIEIADYFAPAGSKTLTFEFTGDFGRDMTYSIAWALFALLLLLLGIGKKLRALRFTAIGLLTVTLLKLFFHDLAQLRQLYRIGALIGVAIIAILASFLYQRFFASGKRPGEAGTDEPV